MNNLTRYESDSIGIMEIPVDAYYGVQTTRAVANFPITGRKLHPALINSLAQVKKASAITNYAAGKLTKVQHDCIVTACDEILEGKFLDSFLVDPIQGGAGTSTNMNANEVIANRAEELAGGTKGAYAIVHPNDHVNMAQSTNDVIPTSGKLTTLVLIDALIPELEKLCDALDEKAVAFDYILKMGRTQLQDAVPMRLGQAFNAYATSIRRNIKNLLKSKENLYEINMGGTAIGTAINADPYYLANIVPVLSELTGYPFVQAEDLFDATQNLDCFVEVSGTIKACAVTLSKICNDLRLLSSGPRTGIREIYLPAMQNGSSIMPGKVNPVIPEVVTQVAFAIIGNDTTIALSAEAGQLELNAFEPVLFDRLFDSLDSLKNAVNTLTVNCVTGITANEKRCKHYVEQSVGIITALVPALGYKKAAEIAKKALYTGNSVRALLLEEELFTPDELSALLDPFVLTNPPKAEE